MPRLPSRLILPCVAILAACAPSEQAGSSGEAPFRAALLTAGPVSDAGWYAGAYEGLMMLRDSLGAEVSLFTRSARLVMVCCGLAPAGAGSARALAIGEFSPSADAVMATIWAARSCMAEVDGARVRSALACSCRVHAQAAREAIAIP